MASIREQLTSVIAIVRLLITPLHLLLRLMFMTVAKGEPNSGRKVALCYVRQSFTRDADDMNSPERQRSNIEAVCVKYGWVPEWYEDVSGHKSGRHEKNRPQWLALKARIGDPDVIAVVANDMARLHRNCGRVGGLLDLLESNDVELVLAAPGREVDTTTLNGKMFLQFGAIIDEFYAEDISQRAKEGADYRKAHGKTIGMPPFGTIRDDEGFLTSSPEGAWLLKDGSFRAGTADQMPEDGLTWRGYYEVAEYILKLHSSGQHGLEKIAYILNDEGWPFRDRKGKPRLFKQDDVRRIIANAYEYGGKVGDKKAKDRSVHELGDPWAIDFDPLRAVFDVELLRRVIKTAQERALEKPKNGRKPTSYPYPLGGLLNCAHCGELMAQTGDMSVNPRLTGQSHKEDAKRTYKHQPGINCGCKRKSVRLPEVHDQIGQLLGLLQPKGEHQETLVALAEAMNHDLLEAEREQEAKRAKLLGTLKRQLDMLVARAEDGELTPDEYRAKRDELRARQHKLQAEKIATVAPRMATLRECVAAVSTMAAQWELAEPAEQQALAGALFEKIVYDLDERRIVDFEAKPWAAEFLGLRAVLLAQVHGEKQNSDPDDPSSAVPHRGLDDSRIQKLVDRVLREAFPHAA